MKQTIQLLQLYLLGSLALFAVEMCKTVHIQP
jgi:hypothetical protein